MEILLITTRPELVYRLNRLLSNILVDNKIQLESAYSNMWLLIHNFLIRDKKHLDLLIVDECHHRIKLINGDYYPRYPNQCATAVNLIQSNCKETYSDGNFYLRNFPIIKICETDSDITLTERFHSFFDYCKESEIDNKIYHSVSSAIAYTRDLIIKDLETLALMNDNEFQLIKINFALYHYDRELNILSKSFVERQKQQYFYWFEYPIKRIEDSINEYLDIIKYAGWFRSREEKKIHRFLLRNPYFILRDKFCNYYYENKLKYPNNQNFIEPDFILKPNEIVGIKKTNVFEVKLPNESIVKKRLFHQNLYSSFWEHLAQIKDYQDYFQMPEVKSEIKNKLGYLPLDYTYTMLISRKEHKEKNQEVLEKLAKQFNFEGISILTYDELLEYQIRFFEREKYIKSLTKYSC
jgi:Domain of unknown function (DUF4263)